MHGVNIKINRLQRNRKQEASRKSMGVRSQRVEWKRNTRPILPCGSRSAKSRSGASLSSSACMSTPKSSKGGDRGAEVQEVELKKASGNGDPGCWGENNSSCMGEGEPNNNRKKNSKFRRVGLQKVSCFSTLVCVCYSRNGKLLKISKNALALVMWRTI